MDRGADWVAEDMALPTYEVDFSVDDLVKDIAFQLPDVKLPGPRGVPNFDKWIFPIIANMAPQPDIVQDLVAVQPMADPAGRLFYADFCHSSRYRRLVRAVRSYLHAQFKNLLRWLRLRVSNGTRQVRWCIATLLGQGTKMQRAKWRHPFHRRVPLLQRRVP